MADQTTSDRLEQIKHETRVDVGADIDWLLRLADVADELYAVANNKLATKKEYLAAILKYREVRRG